MNTKLEEASSLYKIGDKSQAAKLLAEIVQADPNNSIAWYGLALCIDDVDKKIFCLRRVRGLDPSNRTAQQILEDLETKKDLPSILSPQHQVATTDTTPTKPKSKSGVAVSNHHPVATAPNQGLNTNINETISLEKQALQERSIPAANPKTENTQYDTGDKKSSIGKIFTIILVSVGLLAAVFLIPWKVAILILIFPLLLPLSFLLAFGALSIIFPPSTWMVQFAFWLMQQKWWWFPVGQIVGIIFFLFF
jgi:hypothetical protein